MKSEVKYIEVRIKRKKMNISINDMSKILKEQYKRKISPSTYAKKETGKIPITADEIIDICSIIKEKTSIFFKT
ncbi:MAG: hypothetical protein RR290_00565 [Clostridia bacterium]